MLVTYGMHSYDALFQWSCPFFLGTLDALDEKVENVDESQRQ